MAFREVTVVQIREVLRWWLAGKGERPAARLAGVDRKTARRYIAGAIEAGVDRSGGEDQLSDEVIGAICEAVRPTRPDGHGESWRRLLSEQERITAWVKQDLTIVKIHDLLGRQGVKVPYRTLVRFAIERCGAGRQTTTVRVADPPPGIECQVDFGRMGLIPDGERRRTLWALIFTACWSRHSYVWPTFRQTTDEVIAGFEAAWGFFGGVFPVVIPDNMGTIVDDADDIEPRFNDTFLEYAQSRGFMIDPARVRHPTDKPKVERTVPYTRGNWFAGESFVDLAHARISAETWSASTAGLRIHGTTRCRPVEAFAAVEAPLLLAHPGARFDIPSFSDPKVHRDFHVEVARAIYSVPNELVGKKLRARADSVTVKLFHNGRLVKVHPRQPAGGRFTDPADLPSDKSVYAMRDLERLKAMAGNDGAAIGAYATALLDHPLPWTKMRQVYRLLGLVKKWGPERVDTACARALEAEAVNVNLVARMIERALEDAEPEARFQGAVVQGRFERNKDHFAAGGTR
jgi:transposase